MTRPIPTTIQPKYRLNLCGCEVDISTGQPGRYCASHRPPEGDYYPRLDVPESPEPIDPDLLRLFKNIVEARAKAEWGQGWDRLGPTIQAALRAQGVLTLLTTQDDDIAPERLRRMMEQGATWASQGE